MTEISPAKHFLSAVALTCVSIMLLFWVIVSYLPMGFMPAEYAMWRSREYFIDHCELTSTIVLGDSRAAAGFLPSHMAGSTNLALGGSTSVEMYYETQRIMACNAVPQRVILSTSPELFTKAGWFWDRTALYGMFNFTQLEELRRRSRTLHDTSFYGQPKVGDWDAVLDNLLHAVRFPSYYTSYILTHLVVGRWHANNLVQQETLAANGQHGYGNANGSAEIATDVELQSFTPSPLLNEYFERMLDDYAARGAEVDFIATPMNEATYKHMNPAVVKAYQAYLNHMVDGHKNFHVIGSAVTMLGNEYFGDSTHLNHRGAEVHTDRVYAMLVLPTKEPQASLISTLAEDAGSKSATARILNRP